MRIPLTIVGGFLGAGKTTLLKALFAKAGGRKLGIVVNDFGAIDIDGELLSGRADQIVCLPNGCVCCQIGDSLIETLFRMRDASPELDGIIIEASGVSDPAKIAQIGRIGHVFALNLVVTVVDSSTVSRIAADALLSDTLERQLAAADLLVLNKVDLIDANGLASLEKWLERYSPQGGIVKSVNGCVPVDIILDQTVNEQARARPLQRGEFACDELSRTVTHAGVFRGWSLATERRFNLDALRTAVLALPREVVRVKGVVTLDDQCGSRIEFHSVFGQCSFEVIAEGDRSQSNRLVAIMAGDDSQPEMLASLFERALR